MGLAILLIMFFMGYATDRWKSGLPIVAVAMTMLCLLTTNNPSFRTHAEGRNLTDLHILFDNIDVALKHPEARTIPRSG